MTTQTNTPQPVFKSAPPVALGLEGVVVAETLLSHVGGAEGRLIIAGHDVEDLAATYSFEQVCDLLWALSSVSHAEPEVALGKAREAAFTLLPHLGNALALDDAMDALRASVSHLPSRCTESEVVAATAVFAAAHARTRQGKVCIPPDARRGHAEDLLHMLGLETDAVRVRGLDAYLVTVCDHGLNASTFAARVVTSTGSDLVSSVVAGIGALKGPLHGGAPGPVLDMLDAIGKAEDAESWIRAELARGERIMGMGHRIYRVRDPRALVLERAIEQLEVSLATTEAARHHAASGRLRLARATEQAAERLLCERHPTRPLRANVEFYTAVLLEAVGIPRSLFSAIFAAGRVLGWTAHIAEQRKKGRLIRPASHYAGAWPSTQ